MLLYDSFLYVEIFHNKKISGGRGPVIRDVQSARLHSYLQPIPSNYNEILTSTSTFGLPQMFETCDPQRAPECGGSRVL